MVKEFPFPSLIAEATRLHGDMTFLSMAQIFGMVEGDLVQQSSEVLQIGRTGWVSGSIVAQGTVQIEGRVDGDVKSEGKIQLMPSATVKGSLNAPVVEIRAGAIIEGAIKVLALNPPIALKQAA